MKKLFLQCSRWHPLKSSLLLLPAKAFDSSLSKMTSGGEAGTGDLIRAKVCSYFTEDRKRNESSLKHVQRGSI